MPVLAAAGAQVTSFDLSDEQLKKDLETCKENNLDVLIEQGNMQDLSRFADASFDLIFHPCCNVFIPDPLPVWRECFRVLKEGANFLQVSCLRICMKMGGLIKVGYCLNTPVSQWLL